MAIGAIFAVASPQKMSALTAIYFAVTSLSTAGTARSCAGDCALFSRACKSPDVLLGLVLTLLRLRARVRAWLLVAGLEGLKPLEWPGGEFLYHEKNRS